MPEEKPLSPMEEQQQKERELLNKPDGYCSNCGAPNGNNMMNGEEWCFRCMKPFIKTATPKAAAKKVFSKISVSEAEIEAFYADSKRLNPKLTVN